MDKKKGLRWLSTRKEKNGNTAKPNPSSPQDTRSPRLYTYITDLPLNRYIDCVVDGNLAALIIKGMPAEEDLQQAWFGIQQQYADVIGDAEHKFYISLLSEVSHLSALYAAIQNGLNILEKIWFPPLVLQINKALGSNFKFDHEDPISYISDIRKATSRSKGIKLKLDLKLAHFESIRNRHEGKIEKPTREYFQSILITLSDFSKYPIESTRITTFEFADRIRRFNTYCEKVKTK